MKPISNLENKTTSDTYWRVQLLSKKVQGRSSIEPPLEYNQNQLLLTNQGLLWPFNHLGSYRNIIQFQISSSTSFANHKKKTSMAVVFSSRHFPNILKYRDHQWDLTTIWKTRLFQTHIEEFTPLMNQGSLQPF